MTAPIHEVVRSSIAELIALHTSKGPDQLCGGCHLKGIEVAHPCCENRGSPQPAHSLHKTTLPAPERSDDVTGERHSDGTTPPKR